MLGPESPQTTRAIDLDADPRELWPASAYDALLRHWEVGLRVLQLLLRSQQWVHRRVESVQFHDDRTVARRVSVDFTVPTQAPCVMLRPNVAVRLVPLTLLRKKTLVNFDLRDHEDQALPLLSLRQTQALTETMLLAWANVVLARAPDRLMLLQEYGTLSSSLTTSA